MNNDSLIWVVRSRSGCKKEIVDVGEHAAMSSRIIYVSINIFIGPKTQPWVSLEGSSKIIEYG